MSRHLTPLPRKLPDNPPSRIRQMFGSIWIVNAINPPLVYSGKSKAWKLWQRSPLKALWTKEIKQYELHSEEHKQAIENL